MKVHLCTNLSIRKRCLKYLFILIYTVNYPFLNLELNFNFHLIRSLNYSVFQSKNDI